MKVAFFFSLSQKHRHNRVVPIVPKWPLKCRRQTIKNNITFTAFIWEHFELLATHIWDMNVHSVLLWEMEETTVVWACGSTMWHRNNNVNDTHYVRSVVLHWITYGISSLDAWTEKNNFVYLGPLSTSRVINRNTEAMNAWMYRFCGFLLISFNCMVSNGYVLSAIDSDSANVIQDSQQKLVEYLLSNRIH